MRCLCLLACPLILTLAAEPAATPPSLAGVKETDARMPANHAGGWKLETAKSPDPALPRVLLVGDSILSGYSGTVIRGLAKKANVDYWVTPVNQANPKTLVMFREVLATAPYAVVHFNLGLHGVQKGRIPDGQYVPLTTALVEEIRKDAPQAALIWASTTPWMLKDQPDLDGEMNPTVVAHNAMAAEVMAKFHIPITDLYTLSVQHLDLRANALHWKSEGMALQGKAVVASIEKALAERAAAGKP